MSGDENEELVEDVVEDIDDSGTEEAQKRFEIDMKSKARDLKNKRQPH